MSIDRSHSLRPTTACADEVAHHVPFDKLRGRVRPRHVPAASILDSCLQSFGKSVAAKHREETSCARRTSHRFPVAVAGARIEFPQDRPNHHRVIPNRELRLDRWLVSWFVTQAESLRYKSAHILYYHRRCCTANRSSVSVVKTGGITIHIPRTI